MIGPFFIGVFMKWLLLAIPMIIKRFAHLGGSSISPMEEIKEYIKENSVKVLLALTAAIAIGTLFVAGAVLTVINLAAQYDAGFPIRFTAIAAGGVGIMVVSLLVFGVGMFYATSSQREHRRAQKRMQKEGHNIEEVLVRLVNEFIEDREQRRAERQQRRTQPMPSEAAQTTEHRFQTSDGFERH